MNQKDELIVLHVQNTYMNQIRYPNVRDKLLKTINVLVRSFKQNGQICFFLDYPESGGESAITIEDKKNIKTYTAPAGDAPAYQLNTSSVTLTGLWIGACVNNAIMTIVRGFIRNPKINKFGRLVISLPGMGVCKQTKLLDDMYAESVETTFIRAFEYDSSNAFFKNNKAVQDRGLFVVFIRKHKDPDKTISKKITIVPASKKSSGNMFWIELFF
ncbi:hypothetical protein KORDIASMS9_03772 [Kordia sp. SMS9]|nr:hypothetical protein KORDIASMS9_03772 [Kordia sp. SMS9]